MQELGAVGERGSEVMDLWGRALDIMRPDLNPATFSTWFAQAEPVRIDGGSLIVAAPNQFTRDWLEKYRDRTRTALTEAHGEPLDVTFCVQAGEQSTAPAVVVREEPEAQAGASEADRAPARQTAGSSFDSSFTFETFVVGTSNQFAYHAALAVAEAPGKAYNPLFIYGGVGLGKTHLLQAIGNYVAKHFPHLRVRYVSTEQFTNEFINSLGDKQRIEGFRQRYRTNDVLLVDDVQFLSKKEGMQEAFFHTFNALHQAGRQVVVASDRPPGEIPTLEERLRSRFASGLAADIQPPDLETRIAILRHKAQADEVSVPDEVLGFIAERVSSNIRELHGALLRVSFYGSLSRKPIDLSLAEQVLRDYFPEHSARPISISSIQNEVCRYYGVTRVELVGSKRSQSIVYPRQVAMYLSRDLTDMSLPRIGGEFGGRDHTTVMHAVGKVERLMKEHRDVYDQVQTLSATIRQKG